MFRHGIVRCVPLLQQPEEVLLHVLLRGLALQEILKAGDETRGALHCVWESVSSCIYCGLGSIRSAQESTSKF